MQYTFHKSELWHWYASRVGVWKVFVLKHWSIKSFSSPSSSVILLDGVENFLTRPWSPFRFNLNHSDVCGCVLPFLFVCEVTCVCSLVCILYMPESIFLIYIWAHACMCVCVCELSAIILSRLMINLCLTCLFTELLGRPLGVCAARNAANNSSNEKMQMIRLDPAPNP